MKFDYLIFDCYNLYHKAVWIEGEKVIDYNGQKFHTEGITGFLKAAESYIKTWGTEDVKIFWLLDNAKTSMQRHRKSLSEDYKRTRADQPDWFYRGIDILEYILKVYRDSSFLYRMKFL